MRKIRVLYEKTGRSVYISHLDIMRTFQRALTRAGLKVKHTEGFNPHPYISIALPLSLGYTGLCEFLDLILLSDETEAEFIERFNAALPEGIRATAAYEGGRPVRDIAFSEFSLTLVYDVGADEKTAEEIMQLFCGKPVVVTKKSKRGECETDITPMIRELEVKAEQGGLRIRAVLAAGSVSLNPEYLLRAIERYLPTLAPSFTEITRTAVFDADMKTFR